MADELDDLPFDADEIDRLGDLVRSVTDDDLATESPPADLWDAIAAAAGIDEHVDAELHPDAGSVIPLPDRPRPAAHAQTHDDIGHLAEVRPLRRRLWPLVAAVAAAVVLIVGIVAVSGTGDDTVELAAATLVNDGLDARGSGLQADAVLVETDDGAYAVDVSLPDLPDIDGFYELWVIDTDVSGMYSLGPVTGSGTYPLPADVDPAAFPVVDVSIEPTDGLPTHSGVSILRGQLPI